MTIPMEPDRPFHAQLPAERWEEIFRQASMDLRANHSDPEALQALKDSSEALHAYEQEGVEQSSWHGMGSDFKQVGSGMLDAVKGMPKGIGNMLHDVREGHITKAAKDVGSGLLSVGKGAVAPWELAMRELSGEQISSDERNHMLHDSGAALTGLEAMALPGQIKAGVGAIRNGGSSGGGALSPKGPVVPKTEPPAAPNPPSTPTLNLVDHTARAMKDFENYDPYDPKGLSKPKIDQADRVVQNLRTMDAAPHDILWDHEKGGVQPLTPEQINQLLNDIGGKNMSKPPKESLPFDFTQGQAPYDMLKNGAFGGKKPPKTPKASAAESLDDMDMEDVEPKGRTNNPAQDILTAMVPGPLGRMARMLTSLPDATTVRNKALTGALNSVILSGQKPDSTTNR